MVYKTSGVCSSAISFEIDDAGKVHDVNSRAAAPVIHRRCQTGRRHGCQRSYQQNGRDSLWLQTNILPGSACKSSERSSELKKSGEKPQILIKIISVPLITQRLYISAETLQVFVRHASFFRITDIRRCPMATSFWNARAALLAFGETEAFVILIPCAHRYRYCSPDHRRFR